MRSLADLRGKTIGITGVPSDYATLDTALHSAGLTRTDVKVVNVGYNLLPALLAHRVDAVLGVYRNVEGIQLQLRGLHPTIIPVDRAGVPTYDELVLVASTTAARAPTRRTARRSGASCTRSSPAPPTPARTRARALAILQKVTASDTKFLARATPATLACSPAGTASAACARPSGSGSAPGCTRADC